MTRNGILPNLRVHRVADERPIPDIITNFAKATAAATVGEMTMFEGTQVLPILYTPAQRRGTFDCIQHRRLSGVSPESTSIPKGAHALVEVNERQNFKSLFAGKARRHNDTACGSLRM